MSVASSLFVSLVLVLVTTAPGSGADTVPPVLPADVRAALETNAMAFSGLFISGVRTRQPLAPIGTVLETLQSMETEGDFTQPLQFELRFQGPKFRESIQYPPAGASPGIAYTNDSMAEESFDGTKFFIGNRRLKRPENPGSVYVYTPAIAAAYGKKKSDSPEDLSGMQFWYLHEVGFIGPMKIGSLGQPVESCILRAANQGEIVSVSSVGGGEEHLIEIVVESEEPWQSKETFDIETDPRYRMMTRGTDKLQMRMERDLRQLAGKRRISRFILNGAMGYAVQEKWDSRKDNDAVLFHTKNSQFRRVEPDGVWMPMRCEVKSHTYYTVPLYASPHPLYETVIQLDKCERRDFEDDQFRIWYDTPGIEVSDYTSPKATIDRPDDYRVPASIESLEKGMNVRGKGGWFKNRKTWFFALNVLLILAWGCFMYVRSRRNSGEQ